MAYDEGLAERIRDTFTALGVQGVEEKKMFGGLAFLLGGHMCCGVSKDLFMARFAPDATDEALTRPGARPMDFTNRPMKGMAFVEPAGVASDAALRGWIDEGVRFVRSLPPKAPKAPKPRKKPQGA